MVTISIQGWGTFQIPTEKMQELLNWLQRNQGVRNQVENKNMAQFHGRDVLLG